MTYLIVPALLAIGALPWIAFVGSVLGHRAAVPLVGMGAAALALTGAILSALLRTDVTAAVGVVGAAMLVGGIVACARNRRRLVRPGWHALATWLPGLLGGVVWVAAVAIGSVLPHGAARVWAMNGDTQNNLALARRVIEDHGVVLGPDQNPVPVVAAFLGSVLAPGRAGDRAALLAHDIDGVVVVWSIFVMLTCGVVGAALSSRLRHERSRLVAIVSGVGSLLPLTWFVSGIPFHWGWMNVHIAIPLTLAAWLYFRATAERPVLALGGLSIAATLLLATWAPLVFIPTAFGVIILLRHREALRRPPRAAAVVIALGAAQLLAWTMLVTIPASQKQVDAFAAGTQDAPQTFVALGVILLGCLVAGAMIRRRGGRVDADSIQAVAVGGTVALAALLFLARGTPDPLSAYYPTKFAWMLTVVLGVIALATVISAIASRRRGASFAVALPLAVIVVCGFVPAPPTPATSAPFPPVSVITGSIWFRGDAGADRIIDLVGRDDVTILWRSDDPDEGVIDLWVILDRIGIGKKQDFRNVAYFGWQDYLTTGTVDHKDGYLCVATYTWGEPVVIVTSDLDIEADLDERCTVPPRVELE